MPIKYGSAMGDAATFIAPAWLVAYLAVGGVLLLLSNATGRCRGRTGTKHTILPTGQTAVPPRTLLSGAFFSPHSKAGRPSSLDRNIFGRP